MTPKGSGAPPPYWLSQLLTSQQVPQVIRGFQFSDISETLPPAPASFLVGWAMLRESESHWVFFENWDSSSGFPDSRSQLCGPCPHPKSLLLGVQAPASVTPGITVASVPETGTSLGTQDTSCPTLASLGGQDVCTTHHHLHWGPGIQSSSLSYQFQTQHPQDTAVSSTPIQ